MILQYYRLMAYIIVAACSFNQSILSVEQIIKEIQSYQEVDFEAIPSTDLVVFDVDETLIQVADLYLMSMNFPQKEAIRAKIRTEALARDPKLNNEYWQDLESIATLATKRSLVEPIVIDKMQTLKSHSVPFIMCTAMQTGKFGRIENKEEWRYNHLKSLNIEGSYADQSFSVPSDTGSPVFYHGVLATDKDHKGPALGNFIDMMHLNPTQLVMFDDNREFLVSVQQECKKRNLAFMGYWYRKFPIHQWNEKLVEYQLNYLVAHKQWLSDEDVLKIINPPAIQPVAKIESVPAVALPAASVATSAKPAEKPAAVSSGMPSVNSVPVVMGVPAPETVPGIAKPAALSNTLPVTVPSTSL